MTDSVGEDVADPSSSTRGKEILATAARGALTLAIGTLGGFLAGCIHLPLPWMIGAMIASAVQVWFTPGLVWPGTRPLALMVLGLGLGQSFTPAILAAVASAMPIVMLAGVLTICVGVVFSQLFAKLAGTDLKTGYYCAVPGGVIVMAIQAERIGADVATVTFTQSIRLVVVVLTIPPLLTLANISQHGGFPMNSDAPPVHYLALAGLLAAGFVCAQIGRRLRLTNPWMIMPCFMAVALCSFDALPSGVPVAMIDAAQVVLGAALGSKLTRSFLMRSWNLLVASVVSTMALAATLAVLAAGVAWVSGLPLAAVTLGMAPGGMPEMSLTARALDAPVALVLGFHLVRVVLSNLLIEPIWHAAVRIGLMR